MWLRPRSGWYASVDILYGVLIPVTTTINGPGGGKVISECQYSFSPYLCIIKLSAVRLHRDAGYEACRFESSAPCCRHQA